MLASIKETLKDSFNLKIDIASPEEIQDAILSGAKVKGTNMCILILAILIASIGLNMNSTAVIIGAMLISPLMGGIMAIGYGIAINDMNAAKKAGVGLVFQVIICILTSTIYFSLSPISIAHSEILSRTSPSVWDVLIAICGGQVASMISTFLASSASYTALLTPWERMITDMPGSACSGVSITRTPIFSKCSTAWRLWIIGPRVTTFFPVAAVFSTSSTARLTPKQKPALSATCTFIKQSSFRRFLSWRQLRRQCPVRRCRALRSPGTS